MGIPACLWRRTGEIYKGNREFAELVGIDDYMLRDVSGFDTQLGFFLPLLSKIITKFVAGHFVIAKIPFMHFLTARVTHCIFRRRVVFAFTK